MTFRGHDPDGPQPVREVLDQLEVVVERPVGSSSGQRYFRALVSPAGAPPRKRYFLKVALTPLSGTLLQREIQVVLALRGLGLPVPQIVAHNADRDSVCSRFALYEFVHSRSAGRWRCTTGREWAVRQARAVADTICELQSIDAARLPVAPPLLQTFSLAFEEWFRTIVDSLLSPTSTSKGCLYPRLADALRDPAGKPLTDRLLAFAASLEGVFTYTGCGFIVHGDCSPANTRWPADGVAVFVDWEWAGVAPTPWSLPARGRDVANYVTRMWENPDLAQVVVREYLQRRRDRADERLGVRAALIDRGLDKLNPLSAYYEQHWQGTRGPRRFRALSAILHAALTDRIADSWR